MMPKKEKGYALILVLIFLMVGALTIVPMLRFTYTSLKQVRIVTSHNKGLFTADAAQHLVMWKLLRGGLTANFTDNGDMVSFSLTLCDTIVDVSVIMRAVENESGVVLATDYTMIPLKTVSPDFMNKSSSATLEYIIEIKQVSSNTTANLEYIYDILPKDLFSGNSLENFYELGSSKISIDGFSWDPIPDPSFDVIQNQRRLRWPASGNFTDASFKEIAVTDSHYLKFKAKANSPNQNGVNCNWVVAQVGEIPTPSGPQAALLVGDPNLDRDLCSEDGVFNTWKTSYPEIIPPLVSTTVTYTIYITNMSSNSQRIGLIEDILPPGFTYSDEYEAYIINGAGANTSVLPAYYETRTYNGVERQRAWWQSGNNPGDQLTANGWNMAAGENITLTFRAVAEQGVSGSYYNEVLVFDQGGASLPTIFEDIGIVGGYSTYSWNSGTVIVPAFDSSTTSEGENITANYGLDANGITINSWHIR